MKKIVYTRPDGGVSIVHPVRAFAGEEEMTDQQILDRARSKLPVDAIAPAIVDENTLPADRAFRNAWTHDGKSFGVDLDKARDITRERLRVERAPLLDALDVDYLLADETGNAVEKTRIAGEKQRLRDITKQADGISDLGALKALKP